MTSVTWSHSHALVSFTVFQRTGAIILRSVWQESWLVLSWLLEAHHLFVDYFLLISSASTNLYCGVAPFSVKPNWTPTAPEAAENLFYNSDCKQILYSITKRQVWFLQQQCYVTKSLRKLFLSMNCNCNVLGHLWNQFWAVITSTQSWASVI